MLQQILLASLGVAVAALEGNNPLGEVFNLLGKLTATVKSEGAAEAKAFQEYTEWCKNVKTQKGFEIEDGTSRKESLEAKIEKLSADITVGSTKIEDLAADIQKSDAELKKATGIRNSEASDFAKSEKELAEVIDTLGRASTLLDKEMKKNGPAALAQLATQARSGSTSGLAGLLRSLDILIDAAALPIVGKQSLLALVQSSQAAEDDSSDLGAPDAAVYTSHSSSILDVLEDLKEKAEEQLGALRKAEVSEKQNYAMLKQSLVDQSEDDTKEMDQRKSDKAAAGEGKATAEGDLTVTIAELKSDRETLETTTNSCAQVSSDHDATVAARADELKVIAEAIKVLKESTSGAESQQYSFLQVAASASKQHNSNRARSQVATLVRDLAKRTHSAALAQLATRVAAALRSRSSAKAPFDKVKGLIQDMIQKLEAQAGADATEKAFCDDETAKTAASKDELDGKMSKLTTKIDQATARSAKLKGEVKELQGELATLVEEDAEMTKIRQETHANYLTAKADYELGLTGVRKALGVLRDYYGEKDGAAAMLQGGSLAALMQQPEMPEPAKPSTHQAGSGSAGGIIGILEVVESDFADSLSKEEMEEAEAQETYEKMSQENKISNTKKTKDVEYKTKEHTSLDETITELTSDRDTTSSELDAVLAYSKKLDERCVAKPETYEARKARRTSEIAGLKEALSVLEAEEGAFVQRVRKTQRMRGSLRRD